MKDLKIVGWSDFDCEYPMPKWNKEELKVITDLIADEIKRNHYVFAGQDHQFGAHGVPVFSDGTCFRASMRCWGKLMASLYCGPNGEELSYMNFYMSLGDNAVMPEYTPIDVEPAQVEEQATGCTTKEDTAMLHECLEANMDFMTNDKVLKKLFKKMKEQK